MVKFLILILYAVELKIYQLPLQISIILISLKLINDNYSSFILMIFGYLEKCRTNYQLIYPYLYCSFHHEMLNYVCICSATTIVRVFNAYIFPNGQSLRKKKLKCHMDSVCDIFHSHEFFIYNLSKSEPRIVNNFFTFLK